MEEVSPVEINSFWDEHIKYFMEDMFISREEVEYFTGNAYRGDY